MASRLSDREVGEGRLATVAEKNLFHEIRLPGAYRTEMPENPTKSVELRAMERAEVIPFTEGKMPMDV